MPDLDLFAVSGLDESGALIDDYREDWDSHWSCWDCESLARPVKGFREIDHCQLTGREINRVSGICSRFKESL